MAAKKADKKRVNRIATTVRKMIAEQCGCSEEEAVDVLAIIAGNAIMDRIQALPRLDLNPEKYIAEVAQLTAEGAIPSDVSRTLLYAAQLALATAPRDATPIRMLEASKR